jgi:Hypoxia induced protein conserved region
MDFLFYHLTAVAIVAVAIVLGFGLRTMLKGDSPNLSQKFMRWRVGLQFVAIIIIMLAVYFRR